MSSVILKLNLIFVIVQPHSQRREIPLLNGQFFWPDFCFDVWTRICPVRLLQFPVAGVFGSDSEGCFLCAYFVYIKYLNCRPWFFARWTGRTAQSRGSRYVWRACSLSLLYRSCQNEKSVVESSHEAWKRGWWVADGRRGYGKDSRYRGTGFWNADIKWLLLYR